VAENGITGRSAFLALLKDEGITHLFGNPGTTELPIMHALSDHPDLTYVLGLQESVVVAMADGFSRASGQLVSCNVHVAPGLGNAMGAIYNAKFTGTPMIVTAGQQEQGHGLTEPLLYDPLVPIASPLMKWAVEVNRLEDLPRIVRRAAKIAMTPPTGPVFISLPGDILNEEGGLELGHRTRVDTAMRPTDSTLKALAARIMAAKNPVIVAGDELVRHDALQEAADFADAVGAPAYQQTVPYGAHFLSEHPAFMGDLGRNQKKVRAALEPYDLMIVLGADVLRMSVWDEVDAMPPNLPVMQIGLRDWEMGKNYPTEIAVRADPKETLAVLTPVIRAAADSAYRDAAKARLSGVADKNWNANRIKAATAAQTESAITPIQPNYFMQQLVDAIDDDVVVVNEGITTAEPLLSHLAYRDRYGYFGLPSGGIGWAIAASVGIQLAQPSRPVVSVIGDGSAMYSIQALWSAANMKLPITYVICNNQGYRIIKQRLKSFHDNENFIGMDFTDPPINFVGLAESLGMTAHRVTNPADIRQAVAEGVRSGKPNLIEVMVERTV
jgi:benzoylformate decarboxylase